MFCVVYEMKIKPEKDEDFRQSWHQHTEALVEQCGSLGARLHRSDDGSYIAYAQWPDRETWMKGHEFIEHQVKALKIDEWMLEEPVILLKLTVVDSLLRDS